MVSDIRKARAEFDLYNADVLRHILSGRTLRQDMSEEDALQVFRQLQDFLNARYHQVARQNPRKAMKQHEKEVSNAISVFLYGIVSR